MYAIMNQELTAYSHGPTNTYDVRQVYEENWKYIVSPKSFLYGSVLVKMKRVRIGISIKLTFNWKRLPILHFTIENETQLEPDKIIKDHLGEINGKDKPYSNM